MSAGLLRRRWGRAACGPTLLIALCLSPALAGAGESNADVLRAMGVQAPGEAVEAPGFALPELRGKTTVRLRELRGTLVLLNFFATWCDPCREEMPGMERLHRAHRDKGFTVVAVDLQESAKTVGPFVQQLKLSFPVVVDDDGSVSRNYGVRALPVTFLIGRDGNIVWRAIGGRDWESARAQAYFARLVAAGK